MSTPRIKKAILRRLLSLSAGGKIGYDLDDPLPAMAEVLNGTMRETALDQIKMAGSTFEERLFFTRDSMPASGIFATGKESTANGESIRRRRPQVYEMLQAT